MASSEFETPEKRRKMTILLFSGGVACLLLPLAAVLYLHVSGGHSFRGPSGRSDLFDHREGAEMRLTPAPIVVAGSTPARAPTPRSRTQPHAAARSSLDFVKIGGELEPQTAAAPRQVKSAATPPPTAATPARTVKSKILDKKTKKAFAAPKLQPSRGFSSFQGAAKPEAEPAASGSPDMQELLKSLPRR